MACCCGSDRVLRLVWHVLRYYRMGDSICFMLDQVICFLVYGRVINGRLSGGSEGRADGQDTGNAVVELEQDVGEHEWCYD